MDELTLEQQLFWDILRGDPAVFAHRIGKTLRGQIDSVCGLSPTELHSELDRVLSTMLSSCSGEEVARSVKTWLITYTIPIDPTKLTTFSQLVQVCGQRKIDGFIHVQVYPDPFMQMETLVDIG